MHLQGGAPKMHSHMDHDTILKREMLVNRTKIIKTERDYYRLGIYEALFIKEKKPHLNNQETGKTRTLKLFS